MKSLDGFFVRDDLSNLVALDASTPTPGIVLHEYLHQFSAYNFPPLPAWLDEGLAEFYSTFSTTNKGAQVGRPVHEHVLWLRANKLIPLPRLFAITHDDPEYNEQSKQGVFYAESWALVHLLLLGDEAKRGSQLTDYIHRLKRGQSPQEALAVLGDLAALQKELEGYVRRSVFTFRTEAFKDGDVAVGVAFEPLSREDTLFRLGDLLLRTSELQGDAAEHFRAALAVAPKHGGALGGLALIEADAGRWPQAVAGFERAVAASPEDPELRVRLAKALYQAEFQAETRSTGGETPQRLLLAREHAAKAVALRPDSFDGQFLLGLTYVFQWKDVEPGIAALERAHTLAPGRADVVLALGGLQLMADRLDEAKASFQEVVRSTSEPELVAEAKQSLAEVAVAQAFAEVDRTHDVEKAAAAIRAALPGLDPQRRAEVEKDLARLEAARAGTTAPRRGDPRTTPGVGGPRGPPPLRDAAGECLAAGGEGGRVIGGGGGSALPARNRDRCHVRRCLDRARIRLHPYHLCRKRGRACGGEGPGPEAGRSSGNGPPGQLLGRWQAPRARPRAGRAVARRGSSTAGPAPLRPRPRAHRWCGGSDQGRQAPAGNEAARRWPSPGREGPGDGGGVDQRDEGLCAAGAAFRVRSCGVLRFARGGAVCGTPASSKRRARCSRTSSRTVRTRTSSRWRGPSWTRC